MQNVKVWEINPGASGRRARLQARQQVDSRDRSEHNAKRSVWARLILVVALGSAILWWPYDHICGLGVATYLAATSMIVVGGLWVVACTWICRMPRTHTLAMLLALWGVGLLAVEVLPRTGYAKATLAHPAAWSCAAISTSGG